MLIFHIVLSDAWEAFTGESYEAASLAEEGFIHCSFADQLGGVLGRYYSGVSSVVVLGIDPKKLTSKLVSEPSTGGEFYPHIYGPINRDAVVSVEERELTGI